MRRDRLLGWVLSVCFCSSVACGGSLSPGSGDYRWISESRPLREGAGALKVLWRATLTPSKRGNYRPLEHAVAAIDPNLRRVYVGADSGTLRAFTLGGQLLYRFELHERIGSELALDSESDELYVGTERGELFSFAPGQGELRWRSTSVGAIRQKPVLFRDAVYIITEEDTVEALARADGSMLWSFRRDRADEFLVAGHAGLHLGDDGTLYAAFSDGSVIALDALDGSVKWERNTSVDAPETEPGRPRYVDVDTTPVVLGDQVFAASFGAGLYCLDRHNGSVLWREPNWTGIVGMAASVEGDALILVSADLGVARFSLTGRQARWLKPSERGAFGVPRLSSDLVLIGDSTGSLVALSAASGQEVGRIDSGHGFVAPAAVRDDLGFVVTNGGALLALRVAQGEKARPETSQPALDRR